MKIIQKIVIIACTISVSYGATVTVDTGFSIGVTDLSGVNMGVGAGSIRLGYFSTISDVNLATSSYSQLSSDFQTYGGDSAVFGKSGLSGFFAISADTGTKDFSSSFIGKNIYLFGLSTANTEGLIYKFSQTFQVDPVDPTPPSSQNLTFTLSASNYLLGSNDSTLTGPAIAGAGRMATLIPEPSTFLLASLGVLGLLRRRR
jgi:hypothetical protein